MEARTNLRITRNGISPRTLTIYYMVALAVVAVLSIVCHFILSGELQVNESSASLINASGRQRMLSQRIAWMAAEYQLGAPGAREELLTATAAFEKSHWRLISELDARGRNISESNGLRTVYVSDSLDARCKDFIATAYKVAATPAASPALAALVAHLGEQARSPLLHDLEQIVTIYQRQTEARLATLKRIQWGILIVVLLTLAVEALTIFRPMVNRIAAYTADLLRLADTDPLTGAANRRSFQGFGNEETDRARRYGSALSVILLDIDHFKSINDTYGHDVGDRVLISVAQRLAGELRSMDTLGRIGGEEFAILLPETSIAIAADVAERLREAIAAEQIHHSQNDISVTISVGVIELSRDVSSFSAAMTAADRAMYEAKRNGRNRVVVGETSRHVDIEEPIADANGPWPASVELPS